jgi:hypothetical protein
MPHPGSGSDNDHTFLRFQEELHIIHEPEDAACRLSMQIVIPIQSGIAPNNSGPRERVHPLLEDIKERTSILLRMGSPNWIQNPCGSAFGRPVAGVNAIGCSWAGRKISIHGPKAWGRVPRTGGKKEPKCQG